MKEQIRKLAQRNTLVDKIWVILWWMKTKHYARKYSDYEYSLKLWADAGKGIPKYENPQTFDEKQCFLKLSNRNPLLTLCSDKHNVCEYITDCGFSEILKKEYACFDSADDIDFEILPDKCYFKCNHASGMNAVYEKGKPFNKSHFKWKFNYLLRQNPYYLSREWNYKNIEPKLICEEVLEMPDGSDIPEVQFFCFHGIPKFIMYNMGLADSKGNHSVATRWCFDMEWNKLDIKTSMPTGKESPKKPLNFEKMVRIAEKLSEPFPHVRVDLFNINGKIYFNEMTFYSGGGFVKLEPEEWQNILGSWIDCTGFEIAEDAKVKHNVKEEKQRTKKQKKPKFPKWGGVSQEQENKSIEKLTEEQIGIKPLKKDRKTKKRPFIIKLAISYLHCVECKLLPALISDEKSIEKRYKKITGKDINLDNPSTFCEKLNWYKLNDRNSLMTTCADKYAVREYVTDKGYGDCLNKLYGVFDKVSEINLDELPNSFVLKATHGSHMNVVVTDKSKVNWFQAKALMKSWLRQDISWSGREWVYKDIPKRIIAEQYLEDEYGELRDYRFFCFHGKPEYIEYDIGYLTDDKYRNFYDMNQKFMNFNDGNKQNQSVKLNLDEKIFSQMKKIASDLSSDFQQARVDLYLVKEKIYFGEITFFDAGGSKILYPDEWNYKFSENWIV